MKWIPRFSLRLNRGGQRSSAGELRRSSTVGARRRRLIDYPRAGRSGIRRWLPSWRLLLGVWFLGVGCLTALMVVLYVRTSIPDENQAAQVEANVYYWADGSQMVATGPENRQPVSLAGIPVSVRDAVVAAENAAFYSDSGVSPQGVVRAAVNMAKGQSEQGGSTITQQYVKNVYLTQEQTVARKVKEFFIAVKLTRHKSKNQILQGYLNTSWFGRGAYGIQAASYAYYGVPATDLDPSRAAFLAALLKGADQFDPSVSAANHRRAAARWKWILDRQVSLGLMSASERAKYKTFPEPRPEPMAGSLGGQIGYLVGEADQYIENRTGLTARDLARGGFHVHTTYDKAAESRLQNAVTEVMSRDLDPQKRAADRYVQVGAASVDPSDGAVVALYGGADATRHFTDNADTTAVPAGSVFKPFALAAALENAEAQAISPPARPTLPELEAALVTSEHAPFIALGSAVGWKNIRDTAVLAGLRRDSMAPLERTFPIGTSAPSAIRLADAYGTLAHGGKQSEPYFVTRVVVGGRTLDGLDRPVPRSALQPETARVVNGVLRNVARESGADSVVPGVGSVATGVEDRTKSAWFIGYTADLSTAVTVFRNQEGKPDLLPLSGMGGAQSLRGNTLPPRIWAQYMGGPKNFTLRRTTTS